MVKIKDFPKDYRKKEGKRRIECIKFLKRTVSKRYKDKTFLNFNKSRSPKAYEACRTYARNFLSNRDQGIGLFITGAVGSGNYRKFLLMERFPEKRTISLYLSMKIFP